MSIENVIAANTAALEKNTAAMRELIAAWATHGTQPLAEPVSKPKVEPPVKTSVVKAAPNPEPENNDAELLGAEPEPPTQAPYTEADVRAAGITLLKTKKNEGFMKVLHVIKPGAKNLKDLEPKQYAAFIDAANAAIAT